MTSASTTSAGARTNNGVARISRRRRVPLLVAGLVLLLAVVAALLPRGEGRRPFDPDSRASDGGRALSQVLSRNGVTVAPARSVTDLENAAVDDRTTILVVGAAELSARETQALRRHRQARRVVLLRPSEEVLDALSLPAAPVDAAPRVESGCRTEIVAPTDTIGADGLAYRPTSAGPVACFALPESDAPEAGPTAGVLLSVPATSSRPETVIVGQPRMVANAHITRESHAAIAMRLLGAPANRLLWYVPNPEAGDGPLQSSPPPAAPAWFLPATVVTGLTLLLVCLWRGRRLGPLVVEPLPVVVPASETTAARARLYRRAQEHRAVARRLTDAAADDVRRRLRLPADASPEAVAAAVDRATGIPAEETLTLLTAPVADRDLDEHARRLRRLRRKVRTP